MGYTLSRTAKVEAALQGFGAAVRSQVEARLAELALMLEGAVDAGFAHFDAGGPVIRRVPAGEFLLVCELDTVACTVTLRGIARA